MNLLAVELRNVLEEAQFRATESGNREACTVNSYTCFCAPFVGALVAYVNVLADVLSSVAGSVIPPGAEPSRNVLMTAVTCFGALPMALSVRSPQVLAMVSQASVAFVFFFAIIVAIICVSPIHNAGALVMWRTEGILVAFPVVAYGFTAHQFLFNIYSTLRVPSVKRMTSVVQDAFLLCTLLYMTVGACGYAAFRARTAGDLLRNFGGPAVGGARGAFERLLKVGYGASILGAVPLIMESFHDALLPAAAAWAPIWGVKAAASAALERAVTAAVLALALALAILIPNVEFIFGLVGATASVLIAYVLPAAIFLSATARPALLGPQGVDAPRPGSPGQQQWAAQRRQAAALLVFGLLVGSACTRATLMAVREEGEVVQLAVELAQKEQKVVEAVKTEAEAIQVAAAFETVSEAAKTLTDAKEEASATLGAVAQAAAALTGLANTTRGGGQAAGEGRGREAERMREKDKAAETSALALSAVNANLMELKRRVNSTLQGMLTVASSLESARARLERKQEEAAEIERALRKETDGSSGNTTSERMEILSERRRNATEALLGPPADEARDGGDSNLGGRGDAREEAKRSRAAEVAKELAASGGTQRGRSGGSGRSGSGGRRPERSGGLQAMAATANATLEAIQRTMVALADVEAAAAAVERAKGHDDDLEKAQAAAAMERAVGVTQAAALSVGATVDELRALQDQKTAELKALVKELVADAARTAKETHAEMVKEAAEAATAAAAAVESQLMGRSGGGGWLRDSEAEARSARTHEMLLQLANVTSSARGADEGDLTAAAAAAVGIATTAVDAALLNVEQAVGRASQNKQVSSRAEEIARELGRITSEAAAAEASAAEASVGERELVAMELFNDTAISNSTASWFGEADPQGQKVAAKAAFEKRGERTDESVERIDRTDGEA